MQRAYVVLAGLALLAAAKASPRRRREALNPVDRNARANAPDAPAPVHVGEPGFEHPFEDTYPDVEAFQRALAELGYSVEADGDVSSDACMGEIRAFQLDWNVLARHDGIGQPVEIHGVLDLPTVTAVVGAVTLQRRRQWNWFDIVEETLERAKPEVV